MRRRRWPPCRAGGWGRVVAVFQPHRYSRISRLWADFADAFVDADHLVVTDVYAAGETPVPGVSGQARGRGRAEAAHPAASVGYVPRRADLVPYLVAELRPGDLCITLSAGDLTSLPDDLLAALEAGGSGRMEHAAVTGPTGPSARPADGGCRDGTCRSARCAPTGWAAGPLARRTSTIRRSWPASARARGARRAGRSPPPLLIVGQGSNLLVADAGFPGLVVVPGPRLRRVEVDRSRRRGLGARRRRRPPAGRRPPRSPRAGVRASSGRSACPARSAARCA